MNKILQIFSTLLVVLFISTRLYAQESNISGKVVDTKGTPIANAKISVEGSAFVASNREGRFTTVISRNIKVPKEVRVLSKGFMLKDWKVMPDGELSIIMQLAANVLQGQVTERGLPLGGAKVNIKNMRIKAATTDAKGYFNLSLPVGTKVTTTGFMVNDIAILEKDATFMPEYDFIYLKVPKNVATAEIEKTKEETETPNVDSKAITVTVYDEHYIPVPNILFKIGTTEFRTNREGKFYLNKTKRVDVSEIEVDSFQISKFDFDEQGNYMFILVKRIGSEVATEPVREAVDSMIINYRDDFNGIVNEIDLKKEMLAEKSNQIRTEIENITRKLMSEKSINTRQRENLKNYLKNLEVALIQNDVEYENAKSRAHLLLEQMKTTILEKDSLIAIEDQQLAKLRADQRIAQLELILFAILIIGLLFAAGFFFLGTKRIQKQKDEIAKQKDEIEHTYNNIKVITKLGQKITGTLDLKALLQTINANISSLIQAPTFGVGIYQESKQRIEFSDFVENGKTNLYHSESMSDYSKFSVWCLKNQKEVIIGDLEVEYKNYLPLDEYKVTEDMPKSLIYLPLVLENRPIGVLTVQNQRKNAYSDIEIKLLQALASYITVAIDNSRAYLTIKNKNKSITDSIRYAKTIQEATLPSYRQMDEVLQEYFVIYHAKDIVSGDFYWLDHVPAGWMSLDELAESEQGYTGIEQRKISSEGTHSSDVWRSAKTFFAVVDCTGHGVPGGFMSMVANHLLSEIVNVKRVYDPSIVLETLDARLREALKQTEEYTSQVSDIQANDDGMDVSLCMIEKLNDDQTKITFAGARRALYYFSKKLGRLETLKGERASIGGIHRKDFSFTNQEIILEKGDMIYFNTDGITDQHNFDKQKFGSKQFKDILEKNALANVSRQKDILENALREQMKNVEQRDDITIIGIRIS